MKKISFIFVFILCLCFGSCFAGQNLTINQFRELCGVPEDVSIPSELQTILINYNPVIIKSKDENYIYIYPMSNVYNFFNDNYTNTDFKNSFCFSVGGSSTNYYYYFSPYCTFFKNPSRSVTYNCYLYDVQNQTFTSKTWFSWRDGYSFSLDTEGARFGLKIDINNETVESFKSLSNLKNFLEDNLLFNGWDGTIYYNNQNVLYKFDGVYVGQGENITGTTMWSHDDVGFSYRNTYSKNITWFYLQDVPLAEITSWTANDYNTLDSKYNSEYYIKSINGVNFNYSNDVSSYDVTFNKLSTILEKGHIYRLYAQTNVISGDEVVGKYYATTCFFSLNSWKSSAVKVLDLSQYLSTDVNDNITLIPDSSTGNSGTGTGGITLDDLNNNINNGINNINNNIENTILGTKNESGEREGGLVGNLLEGLWTGIVRLIIPSEEQFGQWITETVDSLADEGGILLYSKEFWLSLLNLITNSEVKDFIITLPEFKIPTSSVVIWEQQTINVTSYFKNNSNETIKNFYNIYLVLVSGISIFYFCQYLWSLWEAIISGGSVIPQTNEDMEISESVNMETGQRTTTYSGRGVNSHKYRTSYNHTKQSEHRPIGFGRN